MPNGLYLFESIRNDREDRMKKVLIVDDNVADTTLMCENIKSFCSDVEVRVINSSTQAKAEFESFKPDVAFIDISMPEMDGFQLIEQINQSPVRADRLIIVVSGYSDVGTLDMAMNLGADNYFVKPTSLEGYQKLAELLSDSENLREYNAL